MLPSLHTDDLHADELADRIADLIAELGDTPDAIAHHLAEAGVTGRRADATCCPVANYLRRAEPCITDVDVYGDTIDAWTVTGVLAHVLAPDEIHEFVTLFDTQRYPHLIGAAR
ncbi:hypothetical protein [Actinoplanes sp. NPDC049118]|uniref:hypothetical protein n=1 Tax=Actinoplanes sp. NPDC049118 TaxID=3155769 RepID=UPI0033EA615A